MLAVVGLGNPGGEYEGTRHNVGFRVVDMLAGGRGPFEERPRYLCLGSRIAGKRALLVKPTTYMNRSGGAVADLLDDRGLGLADLLVVSDDVNLPLGRIRIRAKGSDGGQKGLASVIGEVGTEDFARIRLGVGPAPAGTADLADFVLRRFAADETPAVERMIDEAVSCVRMWAAVGVEGAMGRCNRKTSLDEGGNGEKARE
ncbi:MAG: aminoacyl-tRNA hydrolase [Candidatus Eisenbacteria bacterium]